MNILKAFDTLNKLSYKLMWIYWKISDNYRGSSNLDKGLFQFIETIQGKKLEKELSVLTEKTNSSIDKILDKISKNEIIEKENIGMFNDIIIDFANNFITIAGKNMWFNRHNMDANEWFKLNGYYEKLITKVRLLEKVIKEKKDILGITTIWEAIDINLNKIKNF
jgi:hypothetical protein